MKDKKSNNSFLYSAVIVVIIIISVLVRFIGSSGDSSDNSTTGQVTEITTTEAETEVDITVVDDKSDAVTEEADNAEKTTEKTSEEITAEEIAYDVTEDNSNEIEYDRPLTFRNSYRLDEHYEKHGIEMGFSSAAEYEEAARKVVLNSKSLHKIEAEDGDDVYYLEETNEFVIVSTDGYIRTYFNPSGGIDYYNRQ